MFKRAHHQRIARQLAGFNRSLLAAAHCYFGGGTAITLQLDEYRESQDIDFLCSSRDGFRLLRETVTQQSLGDLLTSPADYRRSVRSERDKISTFLVVDDVPIKVEFLLDINLDIEGVHLPEFPVPVVSRNDLFAEKLLANADRGLDRSFLSRDLIDLSMMEKGWGPMPAEAWARAVAAYGQQQISRSLEQTARLIGDRNYLAGCLKLMRMEAELLDGILAQVANLAQQATALNLESPIAGPCTSEPAAPTPRP